MREEREVGVHVHGVIDKATRRPHVAMCHDGGRVCIRFVSSLTNIAVTTTSSLSGRITRTTTNGGGYRMTTLINGLTTRHTTTGNVSSMTFSHGNCLCRKEIGRLTRTTHRNNLGFWTVVSGAGVGGMHADSLRLGSELMDVRHIAGMAGKNHAFDFSTVIIINGRSNIMNCNLNGTSRIRSTVTGNIRSTGGGLIGVPIVGNAVPRGRRLHFNNSLIVVHPTTPNANVVTNNTVHTILRSINIGGILTGDGNSSGPRGLIGTAVNTLYRLHSTRDVTHLHNVSVSGIFGNWFHESG